MFPEPSTSLPDTKDTDQSGKQMQNIFDEQKHFSQALKQYKERFTMAFWLFASSQMFFATSFRTPTYIQMV